MPKPSAIHAREIDECKACGCEDLHAMSSKGKDFLLCEECGQVHRLR